MQLILTTWLKFIQSYKESTGEHMEQNYKPLTNLIERTQATQVY